MPRGVRHDKGEGFSPKQLGRRNEGRRASAPAALSNFHPARQSLARAVKLLELPATEYSPEAVFEQKTVARTKGP